MPEENNKAQVNRTGKFIHKTVCGICTPFCGIDIEMEDGAVSQVKGRKSHPLSKGILCPKGKNLKSILEDKNRISKPLIKKARGGWEEISRNDALDLLAGKLTDNKNNYGAHTTAFHMGHALVRKHVAHYIRAFSMVYGSPNISTCGSHCHVSKVAAASITSGSLPVPDFENSSCIILWGSNPRESCLPVHKIIEETCAGGAKLIVIDPRVTETSRKADIHLRPRPGTDNAVALAFLNIVIEEGIFDRLFAEQNTFGFSEFTRHISSFSPEWAEEISGVSAEDINKAARMYTDNSPACIAPGIALELQSNGFETLRAIYVLQALSGNLEVKGGVITPVRAPLASVLTRGKYNFEYPGIGEKEYPMFYKYDKAQANLFALSILKGEPYSLKTMVVIGSNPLLTWPDSVKTAEAFGNLDFLTVIDDKMTLTAKHADLIIPSGTFWDEDCLWDISGHHGLPVLGLAEKIPFRVNEERGDWQIWRDLTVKMGYEQELPWKTNKDFINYRLSPLNITVDELKDMPDGYNYSKLFESKAKKEGFKTLSGKVEVFSQILQEYEYNPIPDYREPAGIFENNKNNYFILNSGSRTGVYMHSRFLNIKELNKKIKEPYAEIAPADAEKLEINSDDYIIIESALGTITLKALINESILAGTIFIPHGWEKANANTLISNSLLDPVTGFPSARTFPVKVSNART